MAASPTPVRIGDQVDILGESPIWSVDEQALYWVDIRRPALRRLDAGGTVRTWALPDLVGSIAFAPAGRLLVAMAASVFLFDPADGRFETVASLPAPVPGHRFNDGRCDRHGRFWVGTMHNLTRAPEGMLYRLDAAAGLVPALDGVCIPNSLAWSPAGDTMYFADSLLHTIFAHDYDSASGAMGRRRPFAHSEPPSFPDGATVDAEGGLWSAQFNAARIVRYATDGSVDRIIEMPVQRPTCCAFGGPGLDQLYVTTTSQHMSAEQMRAEPLAGALLRLDVGVRGLPEPCWVPGR